MTSSDSPLIVFATSDERTRAAVGDALRSRYGSDYDVRIIEGTTAATEELEAAREAGTPVALILGAYLEGDETGIEFLSAIRELHPTTKRGIVVEWGQFSATGSVFEAIGTGQAHFSVIRPERVRDEEFHASITDTLEDWDLDNNAGFEAVRMIGDRMSARSHELRDMFSRNHIPIRYYDADTTEGARMLDTLGVSNEDRLDGLPVVVLLFTNEKATLLNPTDFEIAEAFGLTTAPSEDEVFDLVIIGAGPAGLAAGVYGASEGRKTLIIEQQAVGGQAGTSSLIRNYPGFPKGISGAKLAFRAFQQAWAFGATFLFMRVVVGLTTDGDVRVVEFADGTRVRTRTVVVATGVAYRRLDIPELEELVGRGVFYGAAVSEAAAMTGRDVIVVGGGNSAGQAALHLAKYARAVTVLVRSDTLAVSMSEYLVRELDTAPNVTVRYNGEVVGGTERHGSLDQIQLRDRTTGEVTSVPAAGLFVLIGSEPRTEWLEGVVLRDGWGFLMTGPELTDGERPWTAEGREPLPFETTTAGVFAAGDVRRGSVKRVASAVGEGAITIQQVHAYLELLRQGAHV